MKNKIRRIGAGLLALLLTLIGCSNPLGERPEISSEVHSGGKIVIQLGGLDARTLGPLAEDTANLKYRLVIQGNDKHLEEDIDDFTQSVSRTIDAGTWVIGVLAYLEDDQRVAWGSEAEVQVLDGETKILPITLLPVTDEEAAGTFDYNITFPAPTADFGYETTTLKLTPASDGLNSVYSETPPINLRDKGAAQLELPAGRYTLDITLESTRQVNNKPLKAIVKETVYIYPKLTTKAHYAFTEAQFGAEVYLKGTASVTNYTTTGQNGNPIRNYVPTKVLLSILGNEEEETGIETADITRNETTGDYEWELLVPSEKLGGSGNVSQVFLGFEVTSTSDPTQKLTSGWVSSELETNQGNTNIQLETTVYSITKEGANAFFNRIEGVSGIAHNSDAIVDTEVRLKIVPQTNYGVIGATVSFTGLWDSYTLESDGTFAFSMPWAAVTAHAQSFHLGGTVGIIGSNPDNYRPVKVEALGPVWNEETQGYDWNVIGSTTTITTPTGAWAIPVPANYVYTGTEPIQFKVLAQATGKPNQENTFSRSVYDLTGAGTVTLSVSLFTVSNVRAEPAPTAITIRWDTAAWATRGYRIYRYNTNTNTWDLRTTSPLPATDTSYSNSNLSFGYYQYAIVGLYGDGSSPTEGNWAQVSATTTLAAPQNVTATASQYDPFQVDLSWNQVTNADYYEIYRNGNYLSREPSWNTSYSDTFYKTPGETYTYEVVARNSTYGQTSSAEDSVTFPLSDLSLGSYHNDSIGAPGEFDYYRFSVTSGSGYYYFSLEGPLNVYGYLYVNGSFYTNFDSSAGGYYFSSGYEVIVAVRASSSGQTGSYRLMVYR